MESRPIALYIHIPFCRTRCSYCDFVTLAGIEARLPGYIRALIRQIRCVARGSNPRPPIRSIYLGGGTPSLLSPGELLAVRDGIAAGFRIEPDLEFTVEANPGDVTSAWLDGGLGAGVNRLSLGMQSADDDLLRILGRRHSHTQTVTAAERARAAGVGNLNLDLIYGIPRQSLGQWRDSLEAALELAPEHVSAYALTIEPGTRLAEAVARREMESPDDDLAAAMYEFAETRLAEAGYVHYELSNWALGPRGPDGLPARACRHNLAYWMNEPFLGFGVGAHGYVDGVRYAAVTDVERFVQAFSQAEPDRSLWDASVIEWSRPIPPDEQARDSMLLGLRMVELGVSRSRFVQRHGAAAWEAARPALDALCTKGLLEAKAQRKAFRLTSSGRLLGNQVFMEFV